MPQVLVVDDDAHIREVVRFALEQAGHRVTEAKDGDQALDKLSTGAFDIVVLDIMMPGTDGLDVCKKIRATGQTPIIFLSSRDDELDRVLGLELGADDYISKPFSPRELVARIKAVLRRASADASDSDAPEDRMVRGKLVMDLGRHRCIFGSDEIVLTVTEFAMLRVLAQAPGRVFTRDQLVDGACGSEHVISDRTVDSHVRRIRRKLGAAGADLVETVYGLGYKMRDDS